MRSTVPGRSATQPTAPIYNLAGQRVSVSSARSVSSVLPKGVYIVGGKKVAVK